MSDTWYRTPTTPAMNPDPQLHWHLRMADLIGQRRSVYETWLSATLRRPFHVEFLADPGIGLGVAYEPPVAAPAEVRRATLLAAQTAPVDQPPTSGPERYSSTPEVQQTLQADLEAAVEVVAQTLAAECVSGSRNGGLTVFSGDDHTSMRSMSPDEAARIAVDALTAAGWVPNPFHAPPPVAPANLDEELDQLRADAHVARDMLADHRALSEAGAAEAQRTIDRLTVERDELRRVAKENPSWARYLDITHDVAARLVAKRHKSEVERDDLRVQLATAERDALLRAADDADRCRECGELHVFQPGPGMRYGSWASPKDGHALVRTRDDVAGWLRGRANALRACDPGEGERYVAIAEARAAAPILQAELDQLRADVDLLGRQRDDARRALLEQVVKDRDEARAAIRRAQKAIREGHDLIAAVRDNRTEIEQLKTNVLNESEQ